MFGIWSFLLIELKFTPLEFETSDKGADFRSRRAVKIYSVGV